ncbi:pyruvate kinase [Formicincola oecophyllae]|uniref:Pyruvate kinase n=1 Tax=Formicincola oecophyllae TaxID=2558361 RepID=A0A4Y6U999_9PROT|nr:pyruvate kinase [Formicincola oecophyllae]QDH13952.1 pyruvate kinase [Formicincola oecophyllae]
MSAPVHHRRTRIVATIGPASESPEMLRTLAKAGANVFRLNFSHGTHAEHKARFDTIRSIEKEVGRPIGILADMQGPKLRVGDFAKGPVDLKKGDHFTFDMNDALGDQKRVKLPHPEIFKAVGVGHRLLVNDGKLALKVVNKKPESLECEVLNDGVISNHKGVNVPDVALPIPALTEKDHQDLNFALSLGVDFIALSFVQRPQDVLEAKDIIKGRAWVISKLEKPQAIEHLEEIVRASDGIMVARGDLGVEMPAEDVPLLQKQIIKTARRLARPVIVATQMLESMIESPVPTRAEVSDVANAVYDGADAVMLSAESAAGDYPEQAVATMVRVVSKIEQDHEWRLRMDRNMMPANDSIMGGLALAAYNVGHVLGLQALSVFTKDGRNVLQVSRTRPYNVVQSISDFTIAHRLTVVWGVFPQVVEPASVTAGAEAAAKEALALAQKAGFVNGKDQHIAVLSNQPSNFGTMNDLHIVRS